jgi:hypothetical protein
MSARESREGVLAHIPTITTSQLRDYVAYAQRNGFQFARQRLVHSSKSSNASIPRRTRPTPACAGRSATRWKRVADESVVEDLIEIATDARHGSHRGLVVAALGNMAKARDRVLPVLLALLDDEDVAGYAVMGARGAAWPSRGTSLGSCRPGAAGSEAIR